MSEIIVKTKQIWVRSSRIHTAIENCNSPEFLAGGLCSVASLEGVL